MVILGIDPGLAHTGWGIIEERRGEVRCRAYGCIETSAGSPLAVRLSHIAHDLKDVVERYRPDTAAVESIYFGANVRSAIPTAHARGAALVALSECALEIGEYTPMQIKQAVVGTGAADKRQVAYMVRTLTQLDHDPHPDHAADALACAICHVNLSRTRALTGGEFYQQRGTGYCGSPSSMDACRGHDELGPLSMYRALALSSASRQHCGHVADARRRGPPLHAYAGARGRHDAFRFFL